MTIPSPEDIRAGEALQVTLALHPGLIARRKWDNLQSIYRVYLGNRADLEELLKAPKINQQLAMELVQNVRDATIRKRYSEHLVRLFHNYVASTNTLIEHSRRLMKGYDGSAFALEYERRRSVVAAAPAHLLVKHLRNYTVHEDVPPFGWEFGMRRGEHYTFTLYLKGDELLAFKRLSSGARGAILAEGERVDLDKLIRDHGVHVDRLNEWMFSQFNGLHGDHIREFNEIADRVNELLGKPSGPTEIR